jgi:hypothetical protein
MPTHIHPSRYQFACKHRSYFNGQAYPAQSPGLAKIHQVPRAPLPAQGVTSCCVTSCNTSTCLRPISQRQGKPCREVDGIASYHCAFNHLTPPSEQALRRSVISASHRRKLPLLHRSYWLMRQTKTLSPASVVPIPTSLCRLSPVPAGRWPFPTLSLQSLRRCLDPYPAVSFRCICSLLPGKQRPHLRRHKFGTLDYPCNATSTRYSISGLQSFSNVQAPTLARPPGCTHR